MGWPLGQLTDGASAFKGCSCRGGALLLLLI